MVLGHNRLSVIDLNPRSHQPMSCGDLHISYNGEVYNYIEIRAELKTHGYEFHTDSDTEVILNAYKHWGPACLQRFVGMWAFAIWDDQKQELFCARDRFGIKPFYYLQQGDSFYFASEIKALKHSGHFDPQLNMHQLNRSIQLKWTGYLDETIYTSVRQLEPRHYLIFSPKGKLRIHKYWDLEEQSTKEAIAIEDEIEQFRYLFQESIRVHLRSDVALGGCLSGGLDSSSIASVVGKDYPDLDYKSFTIYYDDTGDIDERAFVYRLHEKYPGIDGYFENPSGRDDLAEAFEGVARHADVPLMGSSYISQYYLMRMAAKKGVKVILDGQGSDEYLLGYMQSYYRAAADYWKKGELGKGFGILSKQARRQGYGQLELMKRILKSLLSLLVSEHQLFETAYRSYSPFVALPEYKRDTPFELKKQFDSKTQDHLYHKIFHTEMQDLLHYEDRNSMAFSLESRVPFLDHRLVEMAFGIDPEHKVHEGISKFILREALKDYLPQEIYARQDKRGFVTPGEIKWMRGPLRFLIEDINPTSLEMLNTTAVKRVLEAYKKGDNRHADLVWRIASFNWWLKNE